MDMTWRLERPEAITTASQSEERSARLMVTISSALSSSSEALIRRRRSVSGAAIFFAPALTLVRALAGFFAGAFLGDFLAGFLTALLAAFLAAGFLALALAFLAGLRVSSSGYGVNLARARRPLQVPPRHVMPGIHSWSHFRRKTFVRCRFEPHFS
jgi:hypothetical protein